MPSRSILHFKAKEIPSEAFFWHLGLYCKGFLVWENILYEMSTVIDLLAIPQNSLDRAIFSYIFIREVRSSDVRASIAIVHIQKFYKMHKKIVRFRFFYRIAKRFIAKL